MRKSIASILFACVLTACPFAGVANNVTFNDIATEVGMSSDTHTQGNMPVFPYRGSLAVVPSRHGNPWPVMVRHGIGRSARFIQEFAVLGAYRDGHGCTAADFTSPSLAGPDGLMDLYCTTAACHGTCGLPYDKELWVQRPGGGFVNLAQQAGITEPHARGRDSVAVTLTGGRIILAIANEPSSRYPALSIDRAYLVDHGAFWELPLYAATGGARAKSASACVVAIRRGSTLPDLIFCGDKGIRAYRYDGSRYRLTAAYGRFPAIAMLVADVDGADRPELLVLAKTKLSLHSTGEPVVILAAPQDARGMAFGDMNCDGKGDILVVQSAAAGNRHLMLLNNGNGRSYRNVPFPHPASGSGDNATYLANWNGTGQPAMLVTNGHRVDGPTQFVTATCTR